MSVNYGSKRTVVGAHYGLRDWLSQRVTAALIALFTIVVLVQLVASKGPIGYDLWAGIFSAHNLDIGHAKLLERHHKGIRAEQLRHGNTPSKLKNLSRQTSMRPSFLCL